MEFFSGGSGVPAYRHTSRPPLKSWAVDVVSVTSQARTSPNYSKQCLRLGCTFLVFLVSPRLLIVGSDFAKVPTVSRTSCTIWLPTDDVR